MTSQQKSAATRTRRNAFREAYPATHDVVSELLATDGDTQYVADVTFLPVRSVATVKANLTRGCYDNYLVVNGEQRSF